MEAPAVEGPKRNMKQASELIKQLGIIDLQQSYLKHRENFTEKEIKDFYENFRKMDADKDGKISAADISRIASKVGEQVSADKITELMYPHKPTDRISFDEFLNVMKDVHQGKLAKDTGLANLYHKSKDVIKLAPELKIEKEVVYHSVDAEELCASMCFVNALLDVSGPQDIANKGDLETLNKQGVLPLNCSKVEELKKLSDGRIFGYLIDIIQPNTISFNKFHKQPASSDRPLLSRMQTMENQLIVINAAKNVLGCDTSDLEPKDLADGLEYKLLAFLALLRHAAKSKIPDLDSKIANYIKSHNVNINVPLPQQKGQPGKLFERPQPPKKTKPRSERRKEWWKNKQAQRRAKVEEKPPQPQPARPESKEEAVQFTLPARGAEMDPEELMLNWVNFHLKNRNIQVDNFGLDFVDGINFLQLLHVLSPSILSEQILHGAINLPLDDLEKRGDIILEGAKKMGVKAEDIRPVDLIKGDSVLNFAFLMELFNVFEFSKQNVSTEDAVPIQNSFLGYLLSRISESDDYGASLEEENELLREEVDSLQQTLSDLIMNLFLERARNVITEAETEEQLPLISAAPSDVKSDIRMLESRLDEVLREVQDTKSLLSSRAEMAPEVPAPIVTPSSIQREIDLALERTANVQQPLLLQVEKEGYAMLREPLKWKTCHLVVKDNYLNIYKGNRSNPSYKIYLSEAVKVRQIPTPESALTDFNRGKGYYTLKITLSFHNKVILGWENELLMKDWWGFLSSKVAPVPFGTFATLPSESLSLGVESLVPTPDELSNAVTAGDLVKVEDFLKRGADPIRANSWGGNCFQVAAARGDIKMLEFLVNYFESKGFLPFLLNKPTKYDLNTPLQLAAKSGDFACCKLLLDKGGDLNIKNKLGQTALDIANTQGFTEIVNLLAPPAPAPAPIVAPPMMGPRASPFLIRGAPLSAWRAPGTGGYTTGARAGPLTNAPSYYNMPPSVSSTTNWQGRSYPSYQQPPSSYTQTSSGFSNKPAQSWSQQGYGRNF